MQRTKRRLLKLFGLLPVVSVPAATLAASGSGAGGRYRVQALTTTDEYLAVEGWVVSKAELRALEELPDVN
ncbi:hypothetical protein [Halioxenophilus sp. WMMB6]|uniref:hypothetical protein n=1 Tax=Halioxenophilus sp. WMMB6 TaxID=3073815 RepID=UPI00295E85B3|nr:hypothetical protein [Halioxenophilus sp. WMMB6]